jgi:hypothetical protein
LTCLAFSPDGDQIISGSYDRTVRVWDGTPLPPAVLQEHEARSRRKVESVARSEETEDPARSLDSYAALARWDQATAAAARAVERNPDDLLLRWKPVVALVKAGDADGVRRANADSLRYFSSATNPRTSLAVAGQDRVIERLGLAALRQELAPGQLGLAPAAEHFVGRREVDAGLERQGWPAPSFAVICHSDASYMRAASAVRPASS